MDRINRIYNTNTSINLRELLSRTNIKKVKNNKINTYVKERMKNKNMNNIVRNRRPIETNKSSDYIINFSSNNSYYNNYNKTKYANKSKDNSHQFTICDYSKLSPDTYYCSNNKSPFNYYNTQKTINNSNKRYPIIIITKKRNGKIKGIRNNNYIDRIIKIQSIWRGYCLRKMAVGGIKKYIGFIALIKYTEKIFIKRDKIYFLFYLKKNRINFNTNVKKYFSKKIKTSPINNRYEKIQTNFNINNKQIYEKIKYNVSTIINFKNKNNDKTKKFVYKPKKISAYSFCKNKCSYKNNINIKNKIENFMMNLNKVFYGKIYFIFLDKLKINQKMSILNQKLEILKNVIDSLNKKRLKIALNKFRENIINLKAKEELYKSKNIINDNLNNSLDDKEINSKEINNSLLKKLINKKIEKTTTNNKYLMKKFFNIWFNQSFVLLKTSNSFLTEKKSSNKKYIKIKYSHELSCKTESSNLSDLREKSMTIDKSLSRKKIMKVKSIIITKNKLRNIPGSSFNFEPKMEKMYKLINKMNNKKILNKYFASWNKDN